MAGIYWTEHEAQLRAWSAATKAGRSVVKVEIEVSDPMALGFLLRSLGEIEREQRAAADARKASRTGKGRNAERPLLLPAPQLKLTDRRG